MENKSSTYIGLAILLSTTIFVVAIIVGFFMWILPIYNVWRSGEIGKATLQHADYERQVQVVNAQANLQAQKFNAQAEVARANGVAQANNIIKGSITDQYIKYLWVQTLDKGAHDQIIYVPTELGLPITEAGRALPTVPAPSK